VYPWTHTDPPARACSLVGRTPAPRRLVTARLRAHDTEVERWSLGTAVSSGASALAASALSGVRLWTPQLWTPQLWTPQLWTPQLWTPQLWATQSGWAATNWPTVSVFDLWLRTASSSFRLVALSDWRASGAFPV
jgi:hypothetical protein